MSEALTRSTVKSRPAAPGPAPLVSVIIPVYNAARTINEALQSVFSQTFQDFEVIVVDDGSTDDLLDELRPWLGRIIYDHQENAGPGSARNRAIALARGRLFAFLDADDVWFPTKLERQVEYFERFPETGLLHSAAYVSDNPARVLYEAREMAGVEMIPPVAQFCDIFHCRTSIQTLTVMTTREAIQAADAFDECRDVHVEDWDLWLRIAARYRVGFLNAPLAVHRPNGLMSRNKEKTFHGQAIVIDRVVSLCASSCAQHREQPGACLDARRHLLHCQLGYEVFWHGDARQARKAFGRALKTEPRDIRAWCYYVASHARAALAPLRVLRQWLRGPNIESRRADRLPRHNLVHDTRYRRARASVTRTVHALDDRLMARRGDTRHVLFEAASPLSMAVFDPVYRRMRNDPRIQVWFMTNDRTWDAGQIFARAGVSDRVVTPAAIRWAKFDAYINTDFWNMTWLPRRTTRLHLFHGVAGKYGLDAPASIAPVVAAFDRLLFANTDRLNRYADAGLLDRQSNRACLIGYPKVDCLVDGSLDRTGVTRSLRLDPGKPTALYAPTWSPHSSLNVCGLDIVQALARLDINVIVKLHDRSLDKTPRGSGGIDWRARLAPLCHDGRVHIADGYDASPYLYAADLLVSDHSSVAFEFMLLDRPVIIFDCPELRRRSQVNPQKADLLASAADSVTSADDIERAVSMSLADPMRLSAPRRAIANDLFYKPGGAAHRAAQCIYDALSLPMPAPAVSAERQRPLLTCEIGARSSTNLVLP